MTNQKATIKDYCEQFERIADHLTDEIEGSNYPKDAAKAIVERCADELRNKLEEHISENIQKIDDADDSSSDC
jgi:glutamyl-tRNA reductase